MGYFIFYFWFVFFFQPVDLGGAGEGKSLPNPVVIVKGLK